MVGGGVPERGRRFVTLTSASRSAGSVFIVIYPVNMEGGVGGV